MPETTQAKSPASLEKTESNEMNLAGKNPTDIAKESRAQMERENMRFNRVELKPRRQLGEIKDGAALDEYFRKNGIVPNRVFKQFEASATQKSSLNSNSGDMQTQSVPTASNNGWEAGSYVNAVVFNNSEGSIQAGSYSRVYDGIIQYLEVTGRLFRNGLLGFDVQLASSQFSSATNSYITLVYGEWEVSAQDAQRWWTQQGQHKFIDYAGGRETWTPNTFADANRPY